MFAFGLLPPAAASRALATAAIGTAVAGQYGLSVLGGVMGDFLGATICMLELAIYLALAADTEAADVYALGRLLVVLLAPQAWGLWRRGYERRHGLPTVPQFEEKEC